jgi:hypothetical protein
MNPIAFSGSNPPLLSDGGKVGQNLLALLRASENNPDDLDALEQLVECLQRIISITHRRGLLNGDEEIAEKVLSITCAVGSITGTGANKRHGGQRGRSDLAFHADAAEGKGVGPALNAQLIMLALVRILSTDKEFLSNEDREGNDAEACSATKLLLRALGADLCTAICGSVVSRSSPDACTVAEYELVASSGKQLLGNLEISARSILQRIPISSGGLLVASLDQLEDVYALKACLRACCALVTLFGTKLSRSTKILAGLRCLGWECLAVYNDDVVDFAARLVATLPLAGGTDNVTPSDLWNQSLRDAVAAAYDTIYDVAPMGKSVKPSTHDVMLSSAVGDIMRKHIDSIRQSPSDSARGKYFLHLMQGLVEIVRSLLTCDTFGVCGSPQTFAHAQADCLTLLGLVETMLSYPIFCEATFHGTKKRLRSEAIDGGLISISVLVDTVANQVKVYGCELLESMLVSLGGAGLLPFARRIYRISQAALLTSSSAAVRRVVDPSSDMHSVGKRQRRLHNSVKVRTSIVNVFQTSLLAFGGDPDNQKLHSCRDASVAAMNSRGHVENSIYLVSGFILEELSLHKTQQHSDNWGSLYERAELVIASTKCLTASLACSGEFLSVVLRNLVDSVAATGLSSIHDGRAGNGLVSFSEVKASFLDFAACCVMTPWQDGGASSITSDLLETARLCQHDDAVVGQAANYAVRLCEALACPRAPALIVVKRSVGATREAADTMVAELTLAQSQIDLRVEMQKEEAAKSAAATAAKHSRDHVVLKNDKKKPKVDDRDNIIKVQVAYWEKSDSPLAPEAVSQTNVPHVAPDEKVNEPRIPGQPAEENADARGQGSALKDDLDDDEDIPMIVDCGPDEGDE